MTENIEMDTIRNMNLHDIPFSVVGISTWNELANKLDPETGLSGNNWKILAEKLGFTTEHILNIDARQAPHGRNTLKLFEDYIKLNGNSVGAVRQALEDMERPDALESLKKDLPDILKRHNSRNDIENCNRLPVQNSCYDESNHCSSLGFHGHSLRTPPPAHCQSSNYQLNYHGKNSHASLMYPSHVFNDLSRNGNSQISNSNNQTKEFNVMTTSLSNGHGSPTELYSVFSTQENFSKIVQYDPSDSYTSEDMEVSENYDQREEGQPLAAAIQRDQRYRNIAKRQCLTKIDNAEYMDDVEEDSPPLNQKRPDLRLNIKSPPQFFQGHKVISPSPSPASGSGTPLPLAQLNHFTNSDLYMPGVSYNAIMEEKNQQEYEQGRRAQNRDPNFKVPASRYANQPNGRMLDFHVRSAMPDQARKVENELPRTFPLSRSKELMYSSGQSKERPSVLKTSFSVPNGMKPAEYRKGFKHIKVFVTYAGDSKRHIQRVLNLCRCLEKNGFTCGMDMFDKRMEVSNRQDWCAQRFREADFILMCVSPQYKMEVDAYEGDKRIDDKELHIQYIYSLMLAELRHNGHRSARVIPLLFEGSNRNQIPKWLQNAYAYEWPKQYQDLLWCLTKPHTRIRPQTQLNQSSPSSPIDRQSVSL